MPVNPGRLRHPITIQALQRITTPGGSEGTWVDTGTAWAAVTQPTPSGAARYAQAGYSFVTHEVTLRAGPLINLDTRFVWAGRPLEVIAPPRDSENSGRFIVVACREVNRGETDERDVHESSS